LPKIIYNRLSDIYKIEKLEKSSKTGKKYLVFCNAGVARISEGAKMTDFSTFCISEIYKTAKITKNAKNDQKN
jgi:hypothetical protein